MVFTDKVIKKLPQMMTDAQMKGHIKDMETISYKTIRLIKRDPSFNKIRNVLTNNPDEDQACIEDVMLWKLLHKYHADSKYSIEPTDYGCSLTIDNKKLF